LEITGPEAAVTDEDECLRRYGLHPVPAQLDAAGDFDRFSVAQHSDWYDT
jgi:hypothetical protein